MSILWYRLKYFMWSMLSLALCLAAAGFVCVMNVSRFSFLNTGIMGEVGEICVSKGDSVFYLHSPSSQALQSKYITLRDLPFVRGESVAVELVWAGASDGDVEKRAEDLALALADVFGAEILFMEETSGVQSYYGYTPFFSDSVTLQGLKINLHIALCVGEGGDADGMNIADSDNSDMDGRISGVIGSPIIFGGY